MPQMNIKTRTTYEREYNDAADTRPREVRDVSHQLNTQALQRYYDAAKAADDAKGDWLYFNCTQQEN